VHVCVVYASRHGATREIAERIGGAMRDEGFDAAVTPVAEARPGAPCEAYIVGSAVYIGSWLGEATEFVRRNAPILRSRPVWLFTSGPLGTDHVDAEGRSVLEDPKGVAELAAAIGARGTKVFFGAFDPTQRPRSMSERLVRMMPASKSLLPAGDFRDWVAIDGWARTVAAELREPVGTAS
jgi:menaquinone-dependent protoporphyrinogen oxidase